MISPLQVQLVGLWVLVTIDKIEHLARVSNPVKQGVRCELFSPKLDDCIIRLDNATITVTKDKWLVIEPALSPEIISIPDRVEITDISNCNEKWFCRSNVMLFNDLSYTLAKDASGRMYIRNYTNGFTNMLEPHYKLHKINPKTLKIGGLVEKTFKTEREVFRWLTLQT